MTPTSWDMSALRSHIESEFGPYSFTIAALDSMSRANDIFHYHLFLARDSLSTHLDETKPLGVRNFSKILGLDEDFEFRFARIASEANLIACILTLRNSIDIFSNLVNELVLVDKLLPSRCDINKLISKLPASKLKDELGSTVSSLPFTYISAFSNTSKHRLLVNHAVSASAVENRVGAQVGAFEYGGEAFPARWVREVLEDVVKVKNATVSWGCTLNAHCGL